MLRTSDWSLAPNAQNQFGEIPFPFYPLPQTTTKNKKIIFCSLRIELVKFHIPFTPPCPMTMESSCYVWSLIYLLLALDVTYNTLYCVQLHIMPLIWGVRGYLCATSHHTSQMGCWGVLVCNFTSYLLDGVLGSTCVQLHIIPLRWVVRRVLVCNFQAVNSDFQK